MIYCITFCWDLVHGNLLIEYTVDKGIYGESLRKLISSFGNFEEVMENYSEDGHGKLFSRYKKIR